MLVVSYFDSLQEVSLVEKPPSHFHVHAILMANTKDIILRHRIGMLGLFIHRKRKMHVCTIWLKLRLARLESLLLFKILLMDELVLFS